MLLASLNKLIFLTLKINMFLHLLEKKYSICTLVIFVFSTYVLAFLPRAKGVKRARNGIYYKE